MLRNKLNHGGKQLVHCKLQNTGEDIQRTSINGISHIHVLEELILLNVHITQNDPQIQCNSYQNLRDIFAEIGKFTPKCI